jgi:Mg2+ and Co2+ transporter CorA
LTVRAILYQSSGNDQDIELAAGTPIKIGAAQLLWIDIEGRSADDLARAAGAVGLDEPALGPLRRTEHRARILRLPDRIILTIGAVDAEDSDAQRRELDIVVGANHVVTVHDGPLAAIHAYADDISEEKELGRLDAASFTAGLIDAVFAAYFRQIEAIERDIDALDEIAVRIRGDKAFLERMLTLRRRIARLRRALAPNREALAPLSRPDFELRSDIGPIWPGLSERLERAIDAVENARELLVGTFDLYLGRASQRTNDTMKALTVASALALPAVILAGVMGMNFHLDFFDQPSNFFLVIGAMVAASLTIVGIARWRSWI